MMEFSLFKLIEEARHRIKDVISPTPLVYSTSFSRLFGFEVYLKLENLQKTGSFKPRGAYNKIQSLSKEEKKRGVIAASSGNHAQGVAWASAMRGVKSVIVMPETAAITKKIAAKSYGAEVMLHGGFFDEAYRRAIEISKERGLTFIHPFDDELVMAGQGTIGLEILDSLPDADTVIVPIGGGGLISGISTALKEKRRGLRVIGVEGSTSCRDSLKRNTPVEGRVTSAIADGIAIKRVGDKTFPIIKKYVDDVVGVKDDSIAEAILKILERKKLVVEGAGAVTLASLMEGKIKGRAKEKVVLVLSGGNIDVTMLDRILRLGLLKEGRIIRITVIVPDVPGSLSGLTGEIARLRANILHVIHERDAVDVEIGMTKLDIILEVESRKHSERIKRELKEKGYRLEGLAHHPG